MRTAGMNDRWEGKMEEERERTRRPQMGEMRILQLEYVYLQVFVLKHNGQTLLCTLSGFKWAN